MGCTVAEKEDFWNMLDEKSAEVGKDELIIVDGDLNIHIGKRQDGFTCHRGFGHGTRNSDGERII